MATTQKIQRVRTFAGLVQRVNRGQMDFAIVLAGGGLYSSKQILPASRGRVAVFHGVDGSMETLTEKQLATRTNIAKAMKLGSFIVDPR